jgi:hypothetical protein
MDLRAYYQKIRDIEQTIAGDVAVVVSLQTSDGGRAGVLTEVTRAVAARLINEARARLALPDEAEKHRCSQAEAARAARLEAIRSGLQLTVISENDVRALRDRLEPKNSAGE